MGTCVGCMEGVFHGLLMPAEGTYTRDWYGFGPPEPNSLLLIGGATLETADPALSRSFFSDVVGAHVSESKEHPDGAAALRVAIGASELTLGVPSSGEARPWPGQFYVWVEDIQVAWAASKAMQEKLGKQIIVEELCLKVETKVDALVLQDPGSGSVFAVNQAPKGYAKMAEAAGIPCTGQHANALALMDVQLNVPCGSAGKLMSFYSTFLGASVKQTDDGYRIAFAAGEAVRQTLTFKEEDEATSAGAMGVQARRLPGAICVYAPSHPDFRAARRRCAARGLLAGADAAAGAGCGAEGEDSSFCIHRCIDPATGAPLLDLPHVFRSPAGGRIPAALCQRTPESDALVGA